MVECTMCQQNMLDANSCDDYEILYDDGVFKDPIIYGEEASEHREDNPERDCPDCGVSPGNTHHVHCDWAECPRCGDQLLKHEYNWGVDCSPIDSYFGDVEVHIVRDD